MHCQVRTGQLSKRIGMAGGNQGFPEKEMKLRILGYRGGESRNTRPEFGFLGAVFPKLDSAGSYDCLHNKITWGDFESTHT